MCLYPKMIENPKYKPNKKNKGKPPIPKDERVKYVPIGCGKCLECMKQKKRQWQVRLLEEVSTRKDGQFVTLSFSDEELTKLEIEAKEENPELTGYDLDNRSATIAVRRFTENWRNETGHQPRRWLITELGTKSTERIHIHGIIWTRNVKLIHELWKYGNVYIGTYVNGATANYITKYCTKTDLKHPNYQPKIMCSKGIGKGYTKGAWAKYNGYNGENTKDYYTTATGHKLSLPIYYRNKIYNEEQREELWIQRLNRQERWVDGIKIDVSKGDEEYYKVLEMTRQKNRTLGYGDERKNWKLINYERERREIKRLQRHEKAIIKEIPKGDITNIKTLVQEYRAKARIKYLQDIKELQNTYNNNEEHNKKSKYHITMEQYEKEQFERECNRVEQWNKDNPDNSDNGIINNYLQELGKNFESRKDDRIQKIEGKIINTFTGEILGEYKDEEKTKKVYKGIDNDKESIQIQIWS